MNLVQRTTAFWQWFQKNETKLAGFIDAPSSYDGEEIVAAVSEGVSILSENLKFNIGGDHEFTFAISGNRFLFWVLPYVVAAMPEQYRDKWHFFAGMSGARGHNFGIDMNGIRVDAESVLVSLVPDEKEQHASIHFYNPDICSLPENEAYNFFFTFLDILVGETLSLLCINDVELALAPESDMFPLTQLEQRLKETICKNDKVPNPTERYGAYQRRTIENGRLTPRADIFIGTGSYLPLVRDYFEQEHAEFDNFADLGVTPVFLTYEYDIDGNADEKARKKALDDRYDIVDRLNAEVFGTFGSGKEIGVTLGGAMGQSRAYIDLLLFDRERFIERARAVLASYPYYFTITEFRYDAQPETLATQ